MKLLDLHAVARADPLTGAIATGVEIVAAAAAAFCVWVTEQATEQ